MDKFKRLIEVLGESRVKLNEPMTRHTTFKIGGPAGVFFEAATQNDLILAIETTKKQNIPYFIIGSGSNLLVSDEGFNGLVIKNNTKKIQIHALSGRVDKGIVNVNDVFIEAQTGVLFNQLIRYTLDEGFSGLEYFLGQPGTVGGAIWINAHFTKYKVFVGDLVVSAKVLTDKGLIKNVRKSYFNFGYDKTRIQKNNDIVLSVIFKLTKADKKLLWEKAMRSLEFRKKTQPTLPSAGCVFQNIKKADAIRIGTPNYTCSAGYLIDQCGLKGKKEGDVMISREHANFIVNCGNGKARDVEKLMLEAKMTVAKKFKISLIPEIVLLGEF